MKTYITPQTIETKVNSLFAICEPSPGSDITGNPPGIEGPGTGMNAPGRKEVF